MLTLRKNPVTYNLCTDTVTIYHKDGETYSAKVFNRAFFDNKKNLSVDKTGSHDGNSFLLVIPCDTQVVFPGDKVRRGAHESVTTREEWAALNPTKVPDLNVVSNVDVKYWHGRIVHCEAGG